MINQPSPLESLAAFAIAFAAGIVASTAAMQYAKFARRSAAAMPARANSAGSQQA